jgi:sugar phosphate isomerase/epimerase
VQRAETLNKLGRIIQEAGVEMCFHNHDWEFKNDAAEMDYLVQHTDPALVSFMIDIGWVHRAKQDTVVIIRTLLPRTKCYHIKDNTADDLWTEVGQGIIDWHAIFTEIENNPHDPWLTVERDMALPNALESATTSASYLRQTFPQLVGGAL